MALVRSSFSDSQYPANVMPAEALSSREYALAERLPKHTLFKHVFIAKLSIYFERSECKRPGIVATVQY